MYNKKHSNLATIEGAYRTDFGLNHRSAGDAATWLLGIKKKTKRLHSAAVNHSAVFLTCIESTHTIHCAAAAVVLYKRSLQFGN